MYQLQPTVSNTNAGRQSTSNTTIDSPNRSFILRSDSSEPQTPLDTGSTRRGEVTTTTTPTFNTSTAVDATTEFLSRLLLLLGSFVILCLLLF